MIQSVAVVIPAANERRDIGACLNAVAAARRHLQHSWARPIHVRVLVVLDSCTDGTGAVVARHPGVETVSGSYGRVGSARAAGAARVMATSGVARRELWIANTDADSTVAPDWLSAMMAHAHKGADLVLGTVLPGPGLPPAGLRRWHDRHIAREGHPHVHGANFGIRADVYAQLGGWPTLSTGEDVDLAQRAAAAGSLHIVRTGAIAVRTSARLSSRVGKGFATYLVELLAETHADAPAQPA